MRVLSVFPPLLAQLGVDDFVPTEESSALSNLDVSGDLVAI
jgi:hypothetical protein